MEVELNDLSGKDKIDIGWPQFDHGEFIIRPHENQQKDRGPPEEPCYMGKSTLKIDRY